MKKIIVAFIALALAAVGMAADEVREPATISGLYIGIMEGAEVSLQLIERDKHIHGRLDVVIDGKPVKGLIYGGRNGDRLILWYLTPDYMILNLRVEGGELIGHVEDDWPDRNAILTFEKAAKFLEDRINKRGKGDVSPLFRVSFTRKE